MKRIGLTLAIVVMFGLGVLSQTVRFNLPQVAGDPGTVANGDLWYNTSTGHIRGRSNGSTISLDVAGSGGGGIIAGGTCSGTFVQAIDSGGNVTCVATPATELDYAEFTSSVNITATTEATANTIVTGNSVSYDGSTVVIIEFYTEFSQNVGSGAEVHYWLYQDGSSIGQLGIHRNVAAVNMQTPLFLTRRMTPSNASHTYSIRASRVTADGIVGAGTGGAGNTLPGYIRIIRK